MKIGIVSLGCAKNLYDSEMMLGLLKENNWEITPVIDESDIIIVNTCGFIASAKTEAIETIFEMLQYQKYGKRIVVTGCLAERYIKELQAEIPEVDLFIPLKDYPRFGELLSTILDKPLSSNKLSPTMRLLSTPPHWGYLRIGDGCDNRCTYCAIPLIRKGNVSRPLEDIIKEAHILKQKGVKELVLISQDTTRYGRDLNNDVSLLPILLKRLANEVQFTFVRFLYTYPDEITDELLHTVASNSSIVPYFDVPIQHASNAILTAMNRRGSNEFLLNLMKKIRDIIPNAILRTTVIVGFPGETEEDFNCLLEFIKEVQFDRLGAFTYSPEDDTPSANYPNQISEEKKQERYRQVMSLQEEISLKQNITHLNEESLAIVDSYNRQQNCYIVRNYAFAPDGVDGVIYLRTERKLFPGDLVEIVIAEAKSHDLFAKLK